VGTVRTNKKGLPRHAIFPKAGAGKRNRGDMKCVVKSLGPDKDVNFTAGMDYKPVHFLHTTKQYKQTVDRAQKRSADRVIVPQPSVVEDYNFGMRGQMGLISSSATIKTRCEARSGSLALTLIFFMLRCLTPISCTSFRLVQSEVTLALHY
jgi:hypothetical protein